ncbi:response regulator transcription factor [Halomonas marinisediminis]|uniref:Response regulator transcription factor n=1 Tax=Halomonas marinisediminis TaxID=2546095 RepID=A0ABY2DAB0_9GAMM|nr:DNA-binding response regulator [Halomonas marinisediminis]TDB04978.1 response regulator transcription factor [Halomonas marinisediminis]
MSDLRGKKILVVDDAEADRLLISTFLRQLGCRVFYANDGVDGVHKARLIRPDAVLMDLSMPNCNGYDACKLLAEDPRTKHTPVLFLSGYATPEDKVKGLMSGAVDYIAKPFHFDEVKLRLSVHLKSGGDNIGHTINDEDDCIVHARKESSLDEILFRSAQVYLLKDLNEDPGLHELAQQVGTNAKQLNHSFRACVGMTVYEYLREERMKEARKLLVSTAISVSEIAETVGFSSVGTFSTAFKERFGTSPTRFRKQERVG